MRLPEQVAARTALRLPALLYGGLVRLRNRYYDRPGAARSAGLPVVSVGNLTVGGTGKTPLVAWLASKLQQEGLRPAVVSRGYGGTAGRGPLVVSRGDGPLCPAQVCGDEPQLLASQLRGVLVVVGSDRHAGALAAPESGAEVVLLDDGFQHRRLARDVDLVLLDAAAPLGNGLLLPAGPLREPPDALARADGILATRAEQVHSLAAVERLVRRYHPTAPIFGAGHRPTGFFDPQGRRRETPRRAVAFCGIGSPQGFRADLEAQGVELVEFRAYADHHPYSPAEIHELRQLAGPRQAELVTTEKDLVRLNREEAEHETLPVNALRIEAEVFDPLALLELVRTALPREGS